MEDLERPVFIGIFCGVALRWLLLRLYFRLRPDAAILIYASRRGRLQRTLGVDSSGLQKDADAAATAGMVDVSHLDPEVADLEQLLRSLGATVDA